MTRMKRVIAAILVLSMLLPFSGCGEKNESNASAPAEQISDTVPDSLPSDLPEEGYETNPMPEENLSENIEDDNPNLYSSEEESVPEFDGLGDPSLLQYVEDTVYASLADTFASEDYIIENVKAVYYSKEYLEEFAYNSKCNIFFGYTLAELDEQFQGQRYVFTLGDDGSTVVVPFEDYDDTYDQVIKNVAIGTGVILVCVTVSVVSGGAATPIGMIFAASAKTGTAMALSSGSIGAIAAGTVTGIRTGDMDEALKAAALLGSEGFKLGAIFGSLSGGFSELSAIRNATQAVDGVTEHTAGSVDIPNDAPEWRKAELRELNKSGGFEQVSYLNGQKVPHSTAGATRPDVVNSLGDHLEAVEVKYYNLESSGSRGTLLRELKREVAARVKNMPSGTTQRIVLDVTSRGFSPSLVNDVVNAITNQLMPIYPNIPIDVVGLAA